MTFDADVAVVGSGLNGAWAAKVLSERGLSVIVLEAGPTRTLGKDVTGEAYAFNGKPPPEEVRARHAVVQNQLWFHEGNAHLFADEIEHPVVHPDDAPFAWVRSRQVGGRGILWARVALRMSDHEFFAARADGIGPSWPFGHDILAPHYAAVERRLGVAGAPGGGPTLPDGVFEAPLELSPAEHQLRERMAARWATRRIVERRVLSPTTVGKGGWPAFTAQGSCLSDALETGRVDVRSDAVVTRIEADGATATEVRYLDRRTKTEHSVRARAYVLAASTIETVRLLLLSKSPRHPAGLGGSSGLLGRGVMDHVGLRLIGFLGNAAPVTAPPEKLCGAYIPRFTNVPGGEPADFARGYGVFVTLQPGPRADLAIFGACGEMLPHDDNTVTLDATITDVDGIPAPRVTCRLHDNERRMLAHQEQTLRELAGLLDVRIHQVGPPLVPGELIHECGGARMGDDRSRSVTDSGGRLWDAPNVLVVDGASWPSGGYQNPTLTMMAVTDRSCSLLADELLAR